MRLFKISLFLALLFFNYARGKDGVGIENQEWGYVTVRPGAHMFWWLYYTSADVKLNYQEKPLIIWLQGGPGVSSSGYGNFLELGPLDQNLKPRNYSWIKHYNVLFIDNPVGTGFSYVDSSDALARNNGQIAADLLECIKDFYKKLPKFLNAATYIVGESYGGKYAVDFAKVLYDEQVKQTIKSNLKGIGLGSPFISPKDSIMAMGEYLYQVSAIDVKDYHTIKKYNDNFQLAIETERWTEAMELGINIFSTAILSSISVDLYNVLKKVSDLKTENEKITEQHKEVVFLMNHQIKNALNLHSNFTMFNTEVKHALDEDFLKPVIETVEYLLNNTDIKIHIYNGQLDAVVPAPGTVKWINKLNWINSTEWMSAHRTSFLIDNITEGYVKQVGNLKMFWLNRAGHMAPTDNPKAALAVMQDLTTNTSFPMKNFSLTFKWD